MNKLFLLKSGFWTTYGAIATRLLALLSNLLLARLLLPSEFGVIGVAYIFWSFFNLFLQDTFGSFIIYKGLEDKRYLNTTYTITIVIGFVLALGLVAISPLVAQFFGISALVGILSIFAFNLFCASAASVYSGVLTRRMQYKELANAGLITSFIRVIFTAVSALLGLSYWSFAIGDTAFWLSMFFILRHLAKIHFIFQIDSEARAEVLSFCLGSTGSGLGYYVNANCDNFVIGKLLGSTSLGYYNFAYQLTMSITTILSQILGSLGMPVFAQLPDDEQQKNALLKVVEQISLLAAPLYSLFFLVFDAPTISLIFGEKWIPACTVIPWLLIFAYFRLINGLLSSMLSAKGMPHISAKVNLIVAPIAVLSFIIGAQKQGILGVSIAVCIVLGLAWTIYWWWVGCRQLNWPLMHFLNPCFKFAAIALFLSYLSLQVPTLLRPFLFIVLYLICIRILAATQFFQYQSLLGRAIHRLSELRHSK